MNQYAHQEEYGSACRTACALRHRAEKTTKAGRNLNQAQAKGQHLAARRVQRQSFLDAHDRHGRPVLSHPHHWPRARGRDQRSGHELYKKRASGAEGVSREEKKKKEKKGGGEQGHTQQRMYCKPKEKAT